MSGVAGAIFYAAAVASVVTLVWAGLRAAWPVIREAPERFRALDHQTLTDMQDDAVLLNEAPNVAQAVAFSELVSGARENATRLLALERHSRPRMDGSPSDSPPPESPCSPSSCP